MREIVHIQAGGSGQELGSKYWEVSSLSRLCALCGRRSHQLLQDCLQPALSNTVQTCVQRFVPQCLCNEHGIHPCGTYRGDSDLQLEKISVCFHQAADGGYSPRAVIMALEPSYQAMLAAGPYGHLFEPSSCVYGSASGLANWAQGYHNQGPLLMDAVLDAVRKQTELCDSLQSFQLMHDVGSGAGAGLGTLLLSRLREEYPEQKLLTLSELPEVDDHMADASAPYNTMLALHQLIDCADACVLFDDHALQDMFCRNLRLNSSKREPSEHLAAATSGVTCSMRFPTRTGLNGTLHELMANLVPLPRLHFLVPSHLRQRPHAYNNERLGMVDSKEKLMQQVFDAGNMFCSVDLSNAHCVAATATFQGFCRPTDVDELLLALQHTATHDVVDWAHGSCKYDVCSMGSLYKARRAATLLCNTTAVHQVFQKRVVDRCAAMVAGKAQFSEFTAAGMEEAQLADALGGLRDLVMEYQWQQVNQQQGEQQLL